MSDNPLEQNRAEPVRRGSSHRHALIPPSAFHDETRFPTDGELRYVLGDSYASWMRLLCLVGETISGVGEIWKYTGGKTGWALRLVRQDRVIVYLTPQPRQFVVSVALGERAVAAAHSAQLSSRVMEVINAAPRYPEGRGVRITVRDGRELETLTQLARIKCELTR